MSPQKKIIFIFTFLLFASFQGVSQVYINEVAPDNISLTDEDGDAKDWIELYNASDSEISLSDWSISDDIATPQKWYFPKVEIAPKDHFVFFASGKNRVQAPRFFRTAVQNGEPVKYIIPTTNTPSNWRTNNFDDSNWLAGTTGIGYGDNDDNTIVPDSTLSVFIRQKFNVTNISLIDSIIFQVDYDDGFVAYLNGKEIARANISGNQAFPEYDAEPLIDREATLINDGALENYVLSNNDLLLEGENILAIQVHNIDKASRDLSIIPFLSLSAQAKIAGSQPPPITGLADIFAHTNFKIKAKETLYLFDNKGALVDSLFIPELKKEVTYGRFPDGTNSMKIFKESTPHTANSSAHLLGFVENKVSFSVNSGVFNETQQVLLSGNETDEIIRYTTDGSLPLETSTIYDGTAILVDENTIISARIYREDYLAGSPKINSYLIKVNHELPIISLSFKPSDFFDEQTGLYSLGDAAEEGFPHFGANFWKDIERPVHIDFFEEDRSLGFRANAGIKIFGSYSRGLAQRSLSLFFRDKY